MYFTISRVARAGLAALLLPGLMGCSGGMPTPQDPARSPRIAMEAPVFPGAEPVAPPHIEPHLAVHPTDPSRLAVAVMSVSEGPWSVLLAHSSDAGRTWRPAQLPVSSAAYRVFDPWFAWAPDGSALFLVVVSILRDGEDDQRWTLPVFRSTDDGASWTRWGDASGRTLDRPVLLAGDASVFVLASEATTEAAVAVQRAPRQTGRFEMLGRFTPRNGNQILSGAVLDGEQIVFTLNDRSGLRDGRAYPLEAVVFDVASEDFVGPSRLGEAVFVGAPMLSRSVDGRLHSAWVGRIGDDLAIRHGHSADGIEWSEPTTVSAATDGGRFRTIPSIAAGPGGRVAVTWREHESLEPTSCSRMHVTVSDDGGRSFAHRRVLSSAPSCADQPSNRLSLDGIPMLLRWPGGGDYAGLGVASDGTIHAAWTDARSGVYLLWHASLSIP